MKPHSFLFRAAVLSTAAATMLWSCSSEISFDENSFDTGITFGGDSLAIPVGSTDAIYLDDFLNAGNGGLIQKDENGGYFIEFSQAFERSVDVSEIVWRTDIPEIRMNFRESVNLGDHAQIPEPDGRIRMEIESTEAPETNVVDLSMLEEYVASIDRIDLQEGTMLSLNAWGLPYGTDIEVTVSVPEYYVFEQDGQEVRGTLVFKGTDSYGSIYFDPLELKSIEYNIGIGDSFILEEEFNIERLTLVMDKDELNSLSGVQDFTFHLNMDRPFPSAFYGKVTIRLQDNEYDDPHYQESNWISLDGLPSFLRSEDVVLDFSSPHIEVSLESNVGIPMTVNAGLTPYFTGQDSNDPYYDPWYANDIYNYLEWTAGETLTMSISSPFCLNPNFPEHVGYWFSDEPSDDMLPGYEYRQAGISKFMNRIPDKIFMNITGESDINSAEEHYIDFEESDYRVSADVRFNLPLEFGKDLYLPVSDTLYGLPDIMSTVLQSANITVTGNVESAFPVDVMLSAYFLDYDNRRVGSLANNSVIKAAKADGTPTVSPLKLTVSEVADGSSINALVLEFALSGADSELALSDNAYVRVSDIVLKAPGGVTVNSNNMNNNY